MEARVLTLTRKAPDDGSTHWSSRKLAKKLGISHVTVTKIWARAGLKPHRLERYMASDDPDFESKAADIIGLYLNPPEHAAVFCLDEKSHIQALDRLDPVLPLSPGRLERHGFEYFRHGTLSLYAALDTLSGEVYGKTVSRHTSDELVSFLKELLATQTRGREIHVILDNLSAHKSAKVRRFLEANPRITLHFTPTYSSWLNQVEIWFAKIERDVIARGVFTSKADLSRKLMRYIRRYNRSPRPIRLVLRQPQEAHPPRFQFLAYPPLGGLRALPGPARPARLLGRGSGESTHDGAKPIEGRAGDDADPLDTARASLGHNGFRAGVHQHEVGSGKEPLPVVGRREGPGFHQDLVATQASEKHVREGKHGGGVGDQEDDRARRKLLDGDPSLVRGLQREALHDGPRRQTRHLFEVVGEGQDQRLSRASSPRSDLAEPAARHGLAQAFGDLPRQELGHLGRPVHDEDPAGRPRGQPALDGDPDLGALESPAAGLVEGEMDEVVEGGASLWPHRSCTYEDARAPAKLDMVGRFQVPVGHRNGVWMEMEPPRQGPDAREARAGGQVSHEDLELELEAQLIADRDAASTIDHDVHGIRA